MDEHDEQSEALTRAVCNRIAVESAVEDIFLDVIAELAATKQIDPSDAYDWTK